MSEDILTNPILLSYWNETRGGNKTRLTVMEVMSIGVNVSAFDVLPVGTNGFHWTDSLIDFTMNGNQYISFPDIVNGSLPAFSESKGISNDNINMKISNVNASTRSLALGGFLKNAKFNIWLVLLNPNDSTVLYSMLMFSGFVDYFEAAANPNAPSNEMTMYVNSVYKKLDRQPSLIAANSVYQSLYPADAYMSLLGQVNQNQEWKYK